ncbi:molybdopterin molybdotransferase MoeA [Myxococcota bacterium]|nr:molybdopterin molybdotransferase MoeA [Myxococcota bacterium]
MISVDRAIDLVLAQVRPLEAERVPLLRVRGRVLARPVAAPRDQPPWDNTGLDGFAVRAEDVAGASPGTPVLLDVVDTAAAGTVSRAVVGRGQAVRIMTGAPMPRGADSVVMVERTRGGPQATRIEVLDAVQAGNAVRRRGEDLREGEVVLEEGTLLRAGEVGIAAAVGLPHLEVHRRPVVGVLSTGDELVEPGGELPEGSIFSSNSYSLMAMIEEAGGEPLYLGIGRDEPLDLERRLRAGMEVADAVVTSGGVSAGDFDYVTDVFRRMGGDMHFHKVAMRPGKPVAFGTLAGRPLFGLPGNPVSCMVGFALYVRPALLAMQGRRDPHLPSVSAELDHAVRGKRGMRVFLRGILREEEGGARVRTTGPQGSGILRSMALANALIVVPEEVDELPEGAAVRALRLDSFPEGARAHGHLGGIGEVAP